MTDDAPRIAAKAVIVEEKLSDCTGAFGMATPPMPGKASIVSAPRPLHPIIAQSCLGRSELVTGPFLSDAQVRLNPMQLNVFGDSCAFSHVATDTVGTGSKDSKAANDTMTRPFALVVSRNPGMLQIPG